MIEMKTENKTIYKKSKMDHGSVMDEIQNRLDIFLLDCSEEIESFFILLKLQFLRMRIEF